MAALLSFSASSGAAQQSANEKVATYLVVEVAGALGTFPMSVNNSMAVAGYYFATSTVAYGFVQDGGGVLTTFKVAGSVWTEPESINAGGDITGFYETVAGAPQGFIRYANGRIVTFHPPCPGINCEALPVSINDFKQVAGNYPSPIQDIHSVSGGFRRSAAGVFTSYVFTRGGDSPTVVTGMNGNGAITGYFANGGFTSFLVHPDGFSMEFQVPWEDVVGAVPQSGKTVAESINAGGEIAGWYRLCTADPCATTSSGGFVRSPGGLFTLFNPPGTIVTSPASGPFFSAGEVLWAPNRINMNQGGTITGSYVDANLVQHGFVRDPYGVITSFDPPRGMQTTATSINDAGIIAGSFYYDWNAQTAFGFLRIPKR
jgi:hypothetical protein